MEKRAIVTGASSGIGYEIAKQLVAKDWQVLGVALDANYKNDKLEGISYFYYPDKSIKVIDTYDNGQIVKRIRYDLAGNFEKMEEDFNDYWGDGTIKSELKFNEGKINGINKYYYPGGFVKAILKYNNEKLDSTCSYYYENGVLQKEVN